MTTVPTAYKPKPFSFDQEEYLKQIGQIAPELQEAQKVSLSRLQGGGEGVFSPEEFGKITAHYLKPIEERAQQRADSLTSFFRSRGMTESGRYPEKLLLNVRNLQRESAENVEVPLLLEQVRRRGEEARANIGQAADIGSRAAQLYEQTRGQRFGEYSTTQAQALQRGELTGYLPGEGQIDLQALVGGELAGRLRSRLTTPAAPPPVLPGNLPPQIDLGTLGLGGTDWFYQNGQVDAQLGGQRIREALVGLVGGAPEGFSQELINKIFSGVPVTQAEVVQSRSGAPAPTPTTIEQSPEWLAEIEQVRRAYRVATGGELTPEQEVALLQGGSISTPMVSTLAERGQRFQQGIAEGELTGYYRDKRTLAGEAQDLQAELGRIEAAIERARVTGTFIDPQTGDHIQTLEARRQAVQNQLDIAGVTGMWGGAAGRIDAQMLGVDISGQTDDKGVPDTRRQTEIAEQLRATLEMLGVPADEATIQQLMAGGTLQTTGTPTLASRELAGRQGDRIAQNQLERRRQDLQDQQEANRLALDRAKTYGYGYDPVTGDKVETLEAKQQEIQNQLDIAGVTGMYGGVAGQLDARALGVDISGQTDDQGAPSAARQTAIAEQLRSTLELLGVPADEATIQQLMAGGTIEAAGTPTLAARELILEQKRLTLLDKQETDRLALDRAKSLGYDYDPVTGDKVDTLEARLEQQKIDLEQQDLALDRVRLALEAQQELTRQTGLVGAGGRITAADIGVDISGIYRADGTANFDRMFEISEQLDAALSVLGVTDLSDQQTQALLRGESILLPAMRTLAARELGQRGALEMARLQLAGREVTVSEKSQEWQKIIDRARLTGDFIDPVTKLPIDTLEKWDVQLRQAALTGKLDDGTETLQSKMQNWEQVHRDKAVFGFDETTQEFLTPGREYTIDGRTFVAQEGDFRNVTRHVYGTNELPYVLEKDRQQFDKMVAAGFDYTDPDSGETRHVLGSQEFAREQGESDRDFQERMQTSAQNFQERLEKGYDQPVLDQDGNPVVGRDGRPVLRHIEGSQELQSRLADREAALRERGMDQDAAHQQAVLEWDQRRYTGFYQVRGVTFADLGFTAAQIEQALAGTVEDAFTRALTLGRFNKPDGTIDFDRFFAWADDPSHSSEVASVAEVLARNTSAPITRRLAGALGRQPTAADITRLMSGELVEVLGEDGRAQVDWVDGEMGLEKSRQQLQLTLQEEGNTFAESERIAEENYQDKLLTGFTQVDPSTGQPIHVRGTQDFTEYMQGLQDDLVRDGWGRDDARAEAQRTWETEQRVGYDKVVTTTHWDSYLAKEVKTTRIVHVEGTQEFANRQARREELLVRDGWARDDARALAVWENEEKTRRGYFKTEPYSYWDAAQAKQVTGEREVWVPGTEEHEDDIREMADTLTRDGWKAEEALQEARLLAQESLQTTQLLHDKFIQQRSWQWEFRMEGRRLSRTEALAKAEQEWKTGENALDRLLQESIASASLEAARLRTEAEQRMQMLAAGITALSTIGGDLLAPLFASSGTNKLVQALLNPGAGGVTYDFSNPTSWQAIYPTISAGTANMFAAAFAEGKIQKPAAAAAAATNPAVLARFGNWATFGASGTGALGTLAGAGIIVAGVYTGWRIYDHFADKARRNKKERAEFDTEFFADLSIDQQYQMRKIFRDNGRGWEKREEFTEFFALLDSLAPADRQRAEEIIAGGRAEGGLTGQDQNILELANLLGYGFPGRKLSGSEYTAFKENTIIEGILEGNSNSWGQLWYEGFVPMLDAPVTSAVNTRHLLDMGVFTEGFDLNRLTIADELLVETTWRNLPGPARSKVEGEVSLEEMLGDVRAYGIQMEIMPTAELRQSLAEVSRRVLSRLTAGALTEEGQLTRGERKQINQLWIQMGGQPSVSLMDQVRLLPVLAARMDAGGRPSYAPLPGAGTGTGTGTRTGSGTGTGTGAGIGAGATTGASTGAGKATALTTGSTSGATTGASTGAGGTPPPIDTAMVDYLSTLANQDVQYRDRDYSSVAMLVSGVRNGNLRFSGRNRLVDRRGNAVAEFRPMPTGEELGGEEGGVGGEEEVGGQGGTGGPPTTIDVGELGIPQELFYSPSVKGEALRAITTELGQRWEIDTAGLVGEVNGQKTAWGQLLERLYMGERVDRATVEAAASGNAAEVAARRSGEGLGGAELGEPPPAPAGERGDRMGEYGSLDPPEPGQRAAGMGAYITDTYTDDSLASNFTKQPFKESDRALLRRWEDYLDSKKGFHHLGGSAPGQTSMLNEYEIRTGILAGQFTTRERRGRIDVYDDKNKRIAYYYDADQWDSERAARGYAGAAASGVAPAGKVLVTSGPPPAGPAAGPSSPAGLTTTPTTWTPLAWLVKAADLDLGEQARSGKSAARVYSAYMNEVRRQRVPLPIAKQVWQIIRGQVRGASSRGGAVVGAREI